MPETVGTLQHQLALIEKRYTDLRTLAEFRRRGVSSKAAVDLFWKTHGEEFRAELREDLAILLQSCLCADCEAARKAP